MDSERYRHIIWGNSHKEQEVGKKRKRNVEQFIEKEKFYLIPKNIKLSKEETNQQGSTNTIKKDFICFERINKRLMNILSGLELHMDVFNHMEQKKIVQFINDLQIRGRNNELGEYTYSEPKKWMRGKGRVTLQFGCCYNYAEKNGIPPGILQNVIADPFPSLLKMMIERLIASHVLPTNCIPDSCIINIYEPGDCIPPHIDSHDFLRPFSTVSFLSECNIIFGQKIKSVGPGEFIGSASIRLPVGSVLVFNGNGADIAQHCISAVPYKRISVTFRRIDETKRPFNFEVDSDLQNIKPSNLLTIS